MSHWTRASVKLARVDRSILRAAVEILAKELASQYSFVEPRIVENAVVRGWQGEEHVDFAIPARLRWGEGIGIRVTGSGFEIVADVDGTPLAGKIIDVAQRLQQLYTAIAVIRAAQELGWSVNVASDSREAIVLDVMTP